MRPRFSFPALLSHGSVLRVEQVRSACLCVHPVEISRRTPRLHEDVPCSTKHWQSLLWDTALHTYTHQPHATPASHPESILHLLGLEPDKPLLPAFQQTGLMGDWSSCLLGYMLAMLSIDWCIDSQQFGKLFILSPSRQTCQIATDNSEETKRSFRK